MPSRHSPTLTSALRFAVAAAVTTVVAMTSASVAAAQVPVPGTLDMRTEARTAPTTGFSGKLRALLIPLLAKSSTGARERPPASSEARGRFALPDVQKLWARLHPDSVAGADSMDAVSAELLMLEAAEDDNVVPIPVLPFGIKQGAHIGSYHLGHWPAERRVARSDAYEVPQGFIEVGRDRLQQPISQHFVIGQFVTHDQDDVWPKYLVLRTPLIDKLELVQQAMTEAGYRVEKLSVLSGFRTPQYNSRLVGRRGGAVAESRHQYGDAADVFVDNGDGVMADLNGDGRHDIADARVLASAVEAVELAYPELVGGMGIYPALGPHGPFVHIDVRGERARWEGRVPQARRRSSARRRVRHSTSKAVKHAVEGAATKASVGAARSRPAEGTKHLSSKIVPAGGVGTSRRAKSSGQGASKSSAASRPKSPGTISGKASGAPKQRTRSSAKPAKKAHKAAHKAAR